MANNTNNSGAGIGLRERDHLANPVGAHVATAGIGVFVVATYLDWTSTTGENATSATGYETDSVIAFTAFLGVGLAVALQYALKRARRRQHRGLSLTAMAVGIAAVGLALAYILDPPGAFERGSDLETELGAWVALIGAIVWSVGAGMLAKEPEGDDHRDNDHDHTGRTAR